jgi:hypothetical protein
MNKHGKQPDCQKLQDDLSQKFLCYSRILTTYDKMMNDRSMSREEEQELCQLLNQQGELSSENQARLEEAYEDYEPFLKENREFWKVPIEFAKNKMMPIKMVERLNGKIPMDVFSQLMKQLDQYVGQLKDFREKSVDIDTVDDAFSVVRKADKPKEDGLPTRDTNVASFGLTIQLTFTSTHDTTSTQTSSSTPQRKAGDTRAKPLTGSPVK